MRALGTSLCVVFCLFAAELFADCTFGFLTPTSYPANPKPGDVTTGDFNRDGFIDVVVNNRTMSEITFVPGTAGGGFGSPVAIPTAYTQGDIHAADFNNDGKLDLTFAVPWSNDFTVDPHLQVLLGNGDGTFTAVAYTPQQFVFQNPMRMVLGDFNKDGKMDAATTKDSGQWSAMQNVGGFFATKAEYTTGGGVASGIAKGDFDGDGNADIAVSERVSKKVYLWFGNGDGTFTPGASPIDLAHPDREPVDVQSGDFNHDGKDDLAILINGSSGGDNPHGPLKIALSNGAARTFAAPADYGQLPTAQEMMVRDMDGDGNPDVLIAGLQGGLTIFRGLGNGAFNPSQTYGAPAWLGLAVDDFDRDGGPDVVTTNFFNGTVGIYLNTCGHASLSLDSSLNPAPQGTAVTVTGTVTPPPAVAPTGTITLKRGTTVLRSGSLTAGMTLQSTMSDLTPGTYAFTFEYSGDARFIAMTKTLQQIVTVPPFGPPPGLNAISYGGPVQLAWIATTNTDHYEVWRNNGAGWVFAGTAAGASFTDNNAPSSAALLYKVRAVNGSGTASEYGAPDLALTYAFTDTPLAPGVTLVKLAHLTELRSAANAVRALVSLGPVPWSEPSPTVVRASHLTELRTAIAAARTALGLPAASYDNDPLAAGTAVKAIHFEQLRTAMR